MEGAFKDGDAERAEHQPKAGNVWYIPHHGVYHPRKPEKIRVVFDCSAKYDATALKEVDKDRLTAYLAEKQCDLMMMNVPDASHMGGVWERQIRCCAECNI